MGVPEPLLDVVGVPLGVDELVMLPVGATPLARRPLDRRTPQQQEKEADAPMGLIAPMREEPVITGGHPDSRKPQKNCGQNPGCPVRASLFQDPERPQD